MLYDVDNAELVCVLLENCSSLKSTDTIKISKGIFAIYVQKMPRENPTLSDDVGGPNVAHSEYLKRPQ